MRQHVEGEWVATKAGVELGKNLFGCKIDFLKRWNYTIFTNKFIKIACMFIEIEEFRGAMALLAFSVVPPPDQSLHCEGVIWWLIPHIIIVLSVHLHQSQCYLSFFDPHLFFIFFPNYFALAFEFSISSYKLSKSSPYDCSSKY